jgi:hypothetical protein
MPNLLPKERWLRYAPFPEIVVGFQFQAVFAIDKVFEMVNLGSLGR